jgi:general secretion pathway protein D
MTGGFRYSWAILSILVIPISGCTSSISHQSAATQNIHAQTSKESDNPDVQPVADELAAKGTKALLAGEYSDALTSFNEAMQLRIDKSYYHMLAGLAYHLTGKKGDQSALELAEQGYSQAIHFDSSNWLAYYFRGRLRIDVGNYNGAMTDLAEVLLYKPNDVEAINALAFAAYRTGRPDIAAGALSHLEQLNSPAPSSAWRNFSLALAAMGDTKSAARYLDRYRTSGANSNAVEHLTDRLEDWKNYNSSAQVELAQFSSLPSAQSSFSSYGPQTSPTGGTPSQLGSVTAEDLATAKGTEDRMVVIDVVMISTEETIATNQGVNLLNGLSLEFGGTSAAGVASGGYSYIQQLANNGTSSTTITRAITLPSVNYTLNILNANNQRSEVLSRPTLIGIAGKKSEFFSGLELNLAAVAGGGGTGNTILGGQAINIQKEIGVRLAVIPVIMEDGRLKISAVVERTFLQTPSQDVNFTFKLETSKDTIDANVIMRYGETLILGGLSEKETQLNRDGVPGLQDVPGLQYLFSNQSKSEYQKSFIILLTPRPPQYVYQPEKAREAYEKSLSDDERPIANLAARYADWFRPYPNWASVFHHLQDNGLYREFRTGDVDLESWSAMHSLSDRLNQAMTFLHY